MYSRKIKMAKSRKVLLILFDFFCFWLIAFLYLGATKIFQHGVSNPNIRNYVISCAIQFVLIFAIRFAIGIYLSIWRYTNTVVYLKMILADIFGTLLAIPIAWVLAVYHDLWQFGMVASLFALMSVSSRLTYRWMYKHRNQSGDDDRHKVHVAIVGAGQLGAILADELMCSKNSNYKPIFFIDRDTTKVGSRVSGLKVYPEDAHVIDLIKANGIGEIFIALSGLDSDTASALYERYSSANCKIKIYDMPYRNADSDEDASAVAPRRGVLHDFRIEDLLFRKSLSFTNSVAFHYYTGKKVMITGGGGSIGSELCRQIAKCKPAQLVIVDIYENNAYDIQQELIRAYGNKLNLAVEIASVRDRERLETIFDLYRPNIVFHAAAHKHVPLMEHSGCEAIKNNVLGTYNAADMAEKFGVEKFILISTDKAVNPTNIMGASKRMCEMIIQCRTDSATDFAAVRFGNVLGSNGSVIPLFRNQIAEGGPITITDKRIIRYFMTIPEASQLVIQAGAMAKKGELFVLDMGKPVRIYDLAVNMIKLCGLTPDVDIKIEEIGLRPGEKLYEELLIKTELLTKTENSMIFIETDTPLSRDAVEDKLALLRSAVESAKKEIASSKIRDALRVAVPTFYDPDEINKKASGSDEMKRVAESD